MSTLPFIPVPSESPAAEPVTLPEAQLQTRALPEEDPLLLSLIKGARQAAEQYTSRIYTAGTYELLLDGLPSRIDFPVAPVGEVQSIVYLDPDGAEQTLPIDAYRVFPHPDAPALVAMPGVALPAVLSIPGAVRVRFTGGHGTENPVPRDVVHAMLLTVGHLYTNREAVVTGAPVELPLGPAALLWPHRRGFGA